MEKSCEGLNKCIYIGFEMNQDEVNSSLNWFIQCTNEEELIFQIVIQKSVNGIVHFVMILLTYL